MNLFDPMHTTYRIAAALGAFLLAVACTSLHRAEDFLPPEFVELTADADENVLTLRCRFAGNGVCEAGFLLTDPSGEARRCMAETLSDGLFTLTASNLDYDALYSYSAWISNGQKVLYSDLATARTGAMQNIPIPDPAFKEWLVSRYDRDDDGKISFGEAEDIDIIDIGLTDDHNLRSLKGIEYMPNLMSIRCVGGWCDKDEGKSSPPERDHYYIGPYKNNWDDMWGPAGTLEYLDVTHNPKLRELVVCNNSALGVRLGTLDLSNNPDLEILNLSCTWLRYPDISRNLKLKVIYLSHLHGDYPDFSNRPVLKMLWADFPQDSKNVRSHYIDVSKSPDLELFLISSAAFAVSDLSLNPKIKVLGWSYCTDIGAIDLHNLPYLEEVECCELGLDTLDFSSCRHLKRLDCSPSEGLKTLYLPAGITIPGIWPDRNPEHIPDETEIIFK